MTLPTLIRRADWPERMAALIEARRHVLFAWGSHDCCHFAADMAEALTGVDLAGDLRGAYSTEAEAFALLAEHGGLAGFVRNKLGPPLDLPALAQRGDVVYIEQDFRPLLGIVCGAGQWCAPGLYGLQFHELTGAELVWRVG